MPFLPRDRTLGTAIAATASPAATTTTTTATIARRTVLIGVRCRDIRSLHGRRRCSHSRRSRTTFLTRFALGTWLTVLASLPRLTSFTTTTATALAAVWTFGTLRTLGALFDDSTLGAHRLGTSFAALTLLATATGTAFATFPATRAIGTIGLLALVGRPLAATTRRALLATATTTAAAAALLTTTATASACAAAACLLGFADGTAGATRDTHAIRACTETEEPVLAILDGRDRGFRTLQAKFLEPLANCLIVRLAFVD